MAFIETLAKGNSIALNQQYCILNELIVVK